MGDLGRILIADDEETYGEIWKRSLKISGVGGLEGNIENANFRRLMPIFVVILIIFLLLF